MTDYGKAIDPLENFQGMFFLDILSIVAETFDILSKTQTFSQSQGKRSKIDSEDDVAPQGDIESSKSNKQDMHVTVSLFPSSIDGVGCLKVAISDAGRAENKLREGTEKAPSVNGEMQISRAVDN